MGGDRRPLVGDPGVERIRPGHIAGVRAETGTVLDARIVDEPEPDGGRHAAGEIPSLHRATRTAPKETTA